MLCFPNYFSTLTSLSYAPHILLVLLIEILYIAPKMCLVGCILIVKSCVSSCFAGCQFKRKKEEEEEEETLFITYNHTVKLVLCIKPIPEEQLAFNVQCPGSSSSSKPVPRSRGNVIICHFFATWSIFLLCCVFLRAQLKTGTCPKIGGRCSERGQPFVPTFLFFLFFFTEN